MLLTYKGDNYMYKNYINDLVNDSFKLIIQDIEENSETEIEMEEKINRIIENMEDISKRVLNLLLIIWLKI